VPISFPRDHGAHPGWRTEWWYVTGWLADDAGEPLGVQVTFFRNRPGLQEGSRSRFAPSQLLFAHAALAHPAHGRLRHDQRAARAGFGLAEAREGNTDVRLDGWALVLDGDTYRTRVAARDFSLELAFRAPGPPLLQGDRGYSRKGPGAQQASHYYSRPHLAVSGTVEAGGRRRTVRGSAWLDHEWSSEILDEQAQGWDWTGINLHDGRALMAFRMRGRDGGVRWAGGGLGGPGGGLRELAPDAVRMEPSRTWTSPRTGVTWPVAMRLRAAGEDLQLEPLMDDQELDSRASVGMIYWEGAVRALRDGREVGRGYLELTGYGRPVRL
jgi:predicted secreted hydrolase